MGMMTPMYVSPIPREESSSGPQNFGRFKDRENPLSVPASSWVFP